MTQMHVPAFRFPQIRFPLSSLARLAGLSRPASRLCCWPPSAVDWLARRRPPVPRCRGKARCNHPGVDSGAGGAHRRGHHHHRHGPGARLRRYLGRLSALIQIVFGLSIAFAASRSSCRSSAFRRGCRMSGVRPTGRPGSEVPPASGSLTEPILLGGAPRTVAIMNGTLAAAVGLGLQLWIPASCSGSSAIRWRCGGARRSAVRGRCSPGTSSTARCWT